MAGSTESPTAHSTVATVPSCGAQISFSIFIASRIANTSPFLTAEQGMNEGVIRHVNLTVFKMMMEASLEQFFQRDILVRADMTYAQGLNEVVSILLNGIEEAYYGR